MKKKNLVLIIIIAIIAIALISGVSVYATTTATADKILNGFTAYNNQGTLLTGSYNSKGKEWNEGHFTVGIGNNDINVGFEPEAVYIWSE